MTILSLLLHFIVVVMAVSSLRPAQAAELPPNIVLVITDDQGYGDIGAHGNTMIRTPHLDRLHAQSVRLTNFHVDPTCAPTRAALLTGRYSTRTGVWHTVRGRSLMLHDETTLAEVLAANGYRTGIFGKWHLGDNYPMRPQDRGFHESVIHGGGGVGQTPDAWGNDYFDDIYRRNGTPRHYRGYCTDVFFGEALEFVRRNRDRPFFCYLATNVPHDPYVVPPQYAKKYEENGVPQPMANFYGMIEHFDENLGRMLLRLDEWGLAGNTIFIFMTDNGTAAGIPRSKYGRSAGGWRGFDAGMRGAKGSEYDGGHRVPFYIRWPGGGIGGGRDVARLAAHFDVLPTLVDLVPLKFTPRNPLDGISLVPLLRGQESEWPNRTLFVHVQRQEFPPKWHRSAVMTDGWRLVGGEELYYIVADPGQKDDVSKAHGGVVSELREAYERWWSGLEPRFKEYGWIGIGSERENPVQITCHDWHGDGTLAKQQYLLEAPMANGHWMVAIERAGQYEFTLRERPAEAIFPIGGTHARLKIGAVDVNCEIPAGATAISFVVNLEAGKTRLQTWLKDEEGRSRGAYFVDVRRLD